MTPAPAHPEQAGDDAAVFASALRRLFTLAGSPTVRTVADAVGVSAATVSNWRTGRHLPAEFETIEPMLVWLTARTTTESAAGDDVVTVRQWQHLFTTATGRDPALPVLTQIATAAEQWATDTSDPARLQDVRLLLLSCVAVSSTGDLAPRVVNVADSAQHLAAELVDLGVLSPGRDDKIGGQLQLTADALIALAPAPDPGDPAAQGAAFRFGAATTAHIPPGTATEFWAASQAASLHTLRVHQMIAAVFITLIAMILALGLALGAVTA